MLLKFLVRLQAFHGFRNVRDINTLPLAAGFNFGLQGDQACNSASGRGGQPATYIVDRDHMIRTLHHAVGYYKKNGPPDVAQAPMAITYLSSGIWSQALQHRSHHLIHDRTGNDDHIRLPRRGPRHLNPKRDQSYFAEAVDIISIAQQLVRRPTAKDCSIAPS